MNRHTRLVVSVLFFVIIVFSISLTRSYFDGSRDTADAPVPVEIIRRLDEDSAGNRIFVSDIYALLLFISRFFIMLIVSLQTSAQLRKRIMRKRNKSTGGILQFLI